MAWGCSPRCSKPCHFESSSLWGSALSIPHPNLVSKVEHQPLKFDQRYRGAGNTHGHNFWCSWPTLLSTCPSVWLHHAPCQSRATAGARSGREKGRTYKMQAGLPPQSLCFYTPPQLQGRIYVYIYIFFLVHLLRFWYTCIIFCSFPVMWPIHW